MVLPASIGAAGAELRDRAAVWIDDGTRLSARTVVLVVVDTVANTEGGAPTAGADQTQHWSAVETDVSGGGSHEPGAATVTMSWTQANVLWAIGAVPLKPA